MHTNSINLMRLFIHDHITADTGSVLDVGSRDVNGTYRDLFTGWDYHGVDVAEGPGVDEVVPLTCVWDLGRQFDVVISGQCLEHVARPWVLVETMGKHLADGGLLCLIAPAQHPEHRYPIDCYRYLPDGMRELLLIASCEVLAAELSQPPGWPNVDCYAVGRRVT